MPRYKDVEGYRKLFDEEYKKTRQLISEGETHLDNLAEGFSEASRVIDRMPTADVAPKSEVEFWQDTAANAKREAVKAFADRLKKYYGNLNSNTAAGLVEYHIEKIKEEMLCEK